MLYFASGKMRVAMAAVLFVLAGAAAAGEERPALRKVAMAFSWNDQAQWAGYYMAREKGIYERHGLDVRLIPRQGRSDALDVLADGKAEFASHIVSSGAGARSRGVGIVLIGQIVNRSNIMLIARRSAGIETIADFSGKAVCFWDGYYSLVFQALFARYNVRDLRTRAMGPSVNLFTSKQVDACSAMEYNEYHLIKSSPNVRPDDLAEFRLRDLGMDFPEDAIFAARDFAEANPELCRDFVRASLEGWRYAKDNVEETLDVVLRILGADPGDREARELQRWMLATIAEGVFPDAGSGRTAGRLTRRDFRDVYGFLSAAGIIAQNFVYDEFVYFDANEKR